MLVTLDFETYYDKDYTLTKLSTSEYIRDPRFEAISCAIKYENNPTEVFFGTDDIKSALSKIDWASSTLLAHHCHFDGLILTHHFGHVPKRFADTLSMGRALHSKSERNRLADVAKKYGKENKLEMPDFKGKRLNELGKDTLVAIAAYNIRDVDVCYEIYQEMVKVFPKEELDLIDITCRMFCEPVLRVDLELAKEELRLEQERKEKAISESGVDIKVLGSGPKFVKAMEALGVDVPMKPSPTVKDKIIPAIAKSDDAFQALLSHPNEDVVKLVEGRFAAKSSLQESRARRMLLRGENDMRLPIYLSYCGAHTLRWSGGDSFNPQNFKHGHKVGGGLKKAIMSPSKDEVIVVVDSSQGEARLLAWFFDEDWILDAYREGRDVYCEFGGEVYGRIITKADINERFCMKTCILGLGFGMGAPKLQYSLLTKSIEQGLDPMRLPIEVCYNLVNKYRAKCSKIKAGWEFMNDHAIGAMMSGVELEHKCVKFVDGAVELPNGLRLLYPGLDANIVQKKHPMFKTITQSVQNASYLGSRSRTKIYGGLLTENTIQFLNRQFVAEKMLIVSKERRIVVMEHDAFGFIAKRSEAKGDLEHAIQLMSTPPIWAPDLPVAAEGKFDERYPK